MATVTPNFNWPVPTSTDLVKDGATAIEALGDSIDASLLDLKGGTTGQVLSKTTNTDMDFVWVTTDDANAIQNSIVDAKGDLISATANDTPARLAVGNNGETLVADSSTSTGLRYQATQAAGKNYVINGGYDNWQRGTSFALPANAASYCADRWQGYSVAANRTVSRQGSATAGYISRVQRNSANTATDLIYYGTTLESQSTISLVGQSVTMSFSARAGANYSSASSTLSAFIVYGTGTDQNLFTGLTGQATVVTSNVTLTTSMQRFTITGTVNAAATQIAVYFVYQPVGTAGTNDYFDVQNVQLEVGSVATSFSRAGGTIQGELAACQRYYQQGNYGWAGTSANTTTASLFGTFPPMRTPPSVGLTAALKITDAVASDFTQSASSIPIQSGTRVTTSSIFVQPPNFTGLTAYRPVFIVPNEGGAIQLSAEL